MESANKIHEPPRKLKLLPFARKYRGDGLHQNLAIQQKAPLADISQVQKHAGFEGRILARGDLPQAGDARFHFEALLMARAVLLHVFERVRTRAYKTHVALEYVPQLRQLVEAVFAQKRAEPRDARIVRNLEEGTTALVQMDQLLAKSVRPRDHGSKFIAREGNPVFAYAPRRVNDGPLRVQSDGDGN